MVPPQNGLVNQVQLSFDEHGTPIITLRAGSMNLGGDARAPIPEFTAFY